MPDEQKLQWLKDDMTRLEGKVDKLISFKWQVLGASAVIGLIIQVMISVVWPN